MDQVYLSGDQFILVSCLVGVGFMACLASVLVTTRFYKRLLRPEAPRPADPYWFALSFGFCLGLGVGSRVLLGYSSADLSLPGTLLAGLFAGPVPGAIVGGLVGGAAVCHGEWLGLPFGILCGLLGGLVRRLPDGARWLWEFSPYPYMNVYRLLRWRGGGHYVPLLISVVCLTLDVGRSLLTREFGDDLLWSYQPDRRSVLAGVWLSTLVTLGVPLKIWNNTRLEQRLKEQEGLAVRARLDALTQQINPHFLFNTLNSISSAARVDSEMARRLIRKLSMILRRVLDKQKTFVPLAEELEYIDSYLDIEVARFGSDKLRIVKDIAPEASQALVPCMVLQPLVENAVLHAIAPRPAGGTLTIRVRERNRHVDIEIEDDGPGFDVGRLELEGVQRRGVRHGIGLANVHQRLKMAYGRGLDIRSARGCGTRVAFRVPYVPKRELVLETLEKA